MNRKEAPNLFAKSVGTGLRGLMYRRIVLWTLLCGGIAATCVYGAAEMLFTRVYAFSRESSEREAENRLRLFDTMIARSERDSLENGRRALTELAKLHAKTARWTSSGAVRASQAELAREAAALGISEIYLVAPDGIVAATSFAPDLGLDLFSLGPDFVSFLRSVYGSGEAVDQTLSGSTMTGTINSYQYYSPKGGDYLIEISTRLDDAIGRSYPGLDYDGLVDLAFGARADSQAGRSPIPDLERIVDLIAVRGISHWSLFQRRSMNPGTPPSSPAPCEGKSAWARGREASSSKSSPSPSPRARSAGATRPTTPYSRSTSGPSRIPPLRPSLRPRRLLPRDRPLLRRHEALFRPERRAAGSSACAQASPAPPRRRLPRRFDDYGADEIGDNRPEHLDSMVRTMLEKEERLRAAQRMETVGAMAGGLAHDFSNILTGISGTIECIELRLASGGRQARGHAGDDCASLRARPSGAAELVRALIDMAPTRPPERQSRRPGRDRPGGRRARHRQRERKLSR